MDRELKAKWVSALKSGNYKQGFGKLKSGDCFCALGVLCSIVNPKDLDLVSFNELGLHYMTGGRIIELNDYQRKSFDEIANWVEQNIKAD